MKVLFLSHYFPPEVNAPASRTYEHCVRWANAGHDVTVVTCTPNCPTGVAYDGFRNRMMRQVSRVDRIKVVRVWTFLTPNRGVRRRILNYLSYLVFATFACLRLPKPDVVVATSPQFFCGWAGVFVKWLTGAPLVLEIRDIWPESIVAVGALRNGFVIRLLERLERRMYLAADHIVTVGDGYRKIIERTTEGRVPVSVVNNGVDTEIFCPSRQDAALREQWQLTGKSVCSYIGTIGMAHGLEVVVDAAVILRDRGRDDIRFLLVGDGAVREELQQHATSAGVDEWIRFAGSVDRSQVPGVLAASDSCLVHLRKCRLFDTVIPSKLYEYMAMERPLIMGVCGESWRIVQDAGAGLAMEPGNGVSLADCLEQIADRPAWASSRGREGRKYVVSRFSRDLMAGRMLSVLSAVASKRSAVDSVPLPEKLIETPEPLQLEPIPAIESLVHES